MNKIKQKLRELFTIPKDYKILFVNGHALNASEIVINSYAHTQFIALGGNNPSALLLDEVARSHGKSQKTSLKSVYMYQYEELLSKLNTCSTKDKSRLKLVNSDVAFPYYDPLDCMVWVTSFDFLGAYGVSMIVVAPEIYNSPKILYKPRSAFNQFSLNSCLQEKSHPLIKVNKSALIALQSKLSTFNLQEYRDDINYKRQILFDYFYENVRGEGIVFTIDSGAIPEQVIKDWKCLESKHGVHLYLYEWSSMAYEQFIEDVQDAKSV